jgi:hypothetical protein
MRITALDLLLVLAACVAVSNAQIDLKFGVANFPKFCSGASVIQYPPHSTVSCNTPHHVFQKAAPFFRRLTRVRVFSRHHLLLLCAQHPNHTILFATIWASPASDKGSACMPSAINWRVKILHSTALSYKKTTDLIFLKLYLELKFVSGFEFFHFLPMFFTEAT